MDIVTVSAVAGSVASCVAVVPLGIAGVRYTRGWWQERRDRREAQKVPQVIRTTQDTGAYHPCVVGELQALSAEVEARYGGSISRSTVINTGVAGYDIDVIPQMPSP